MALGLIGKKLGMTRVYDERGEIHPVTVIHVGGNVVTQVKTVARDGYDSLQVGYDDQKGQRLAKAQQGHFKKAGAPTKKALREFRSGPEGLEPGQVVAAGRFSAGQFVDVIGVTKGKGFAGVMKKHNTKGQGQSHGSMMHRRVGAIGMRSTPGRIWKNASMPGHLGDDRQTVQNLQILQVREDDGVIVVRGSVPGAPGKYLIVRPAKKKPAPKR